MKLTDNITDNIIFSRKNQYDVLTVMQRRNKWEVICNKIICIEKGYPGMEKFATIYNYNK